MPRDPGTGKTVWHMMLDAELLEFHLKQMEGSQCEEVRKGKRHANAPSDVGEQEGMA